jgi:glycosyltransferase involved in cell wall biosynthesis
MYFISVCIPAYNRAVLLSVLLDSILSQDFNDFDIVVAEDCSPERQLIAAKVANYQHRFPGKLTYQENADTLGYDGNLRRLVELATGDYLLFMGNDDLLAPGALSAIAKALRKQRGTGVVLRSYASFMTSPEEPEQVFRYFSEDRVFPPGPDTVVTFFRRSVFISGMVFKRTSALTHATERFDGTLLYQQHLAGQILMRESGLYLNRVMSYHRLGGIPDFGASTSERGHFVPQQQTPESSVHFVQGMLTIAYSLDKLGDSLVGRRILWDIGNYAYPILSLQADQPFIIFIRYLIQLMKLGFWRIPLFHVYAISLLILGPRSCDVLIAFIKKKLGRAPMIGRLYAGSSLLASDE